MNDENLIDISTRADHKELASKGGKKKKGTKHLKTVLKELLSAQDPEGEWSGPVSKKLLQKAFNDNDFRALVEIIDRIEGKSVQRAVIEERNKYTEFGGVSDEELIERAKRKYGGQSVGGDSAQGKD